MPSKPRPRSRSRSSTELALAGALALLVAACSDDARCGIGDTGDRALGIAVTVGSETVTFGGFTSSANNDCSVNGSGVISLTIQGQQQGASSAMSLCLPRPDLIEQQAALSGNHVPPTETDRVQLFDVSVTLANNCTGRLQTGATPAGTAGFIGYCGAGLDPAGYGLEVDGTVMLDVTCASGTTAMAAELHGLVEVDAQ